MPLSFFPTHPFQSTLPARGATATSGHQPPEDGDFNPRSPHGERPPAATSRRRTEISIHAPRTGSDLTAQLPGDGHKNFNPRSPHGERQLSCTNCGGKAIFQSTLPARGATRLRLCRKAPESHISIHAPRTGSDPRRVVAYSDVDVFQSTLPARGATYQQTAIEKIYSISIHAPRTGSDGIVMPQGRTRGGFQSTLPARGATNLPNPAGSLSDNFNPRSPHGERPPRGTNEAAEWHFNPRSPHGERLSVSARCSQVYCISIHAPRTGSDNNILPISSLC